MNKWILSGGLAAFLAAGLPWTASYGAPYAPGIRPFLNSGLFIMTGPFPLKRRRTGMRSTTTPLDSHGRPGTGILRSRSF